MIKINFISDLPAEIWKRQEVEQNQVQWCYSTHPVDADAYVVFGTTRPLCFVNSSGPRVFFTPEPPEIFKYDLQVLSEYDKVVSGNFAYLKSLKNLAVRTGILNWSVGVSNRNHEIQELKNIETIEALAKRDRERKLSVVTSLKTITPFQKLRLNFLEYLDKRMDNLIIFGNGIQQVNDKADVLLRFSHHLAIENSIHPSFWTEKLSDPLLTMTRTFYVGHESTTNEFGQDSFVPLKLEDFDSAYRKIRTEFERDLTEEVVLRMEAAKNNIRYRANVHYHAVDLVTECIKNPRREKPKKLKAHKSQILKRLHFYLNYKSSRYSFMHAGNLEDFTDWT